MRGPFWGRGLGLGGRGSVGVRSLSQVWSAVEGRGEGLTALRASRDDSESSARA